MSTSAYTTAELQKILDISRPAVYKRAKANGWASDKRLMPQGGTCKVFLVPNEQIDSNLAQKSLSDSNFLPPAEPPKITKSIVTDSNLKKGGEQVGEQVAQNLPVIRKNSSTDAALHDSNQQGEGAGDSNQPLNIADSTDWIPMAEAAEAFGIKRQSLDEKAKKAGWQIIKYQAPGQVCKQYLKVDVLPLPEQEKWRDSQIARMGHNLPAVIAEEQQAFAALSEADRRQAMAKWEIVRAWRTGKIWAKATKTRLGDFEATFAAQMSVELASQLEVLGTFKVGLSTIKLWDKTLKVNGCHRYPVCLADSRKGKAGRPRKNDYDAVRQLVFRIVKLNPYANISFIRAKVLEELPRQKYSERSLALWLTEAKREVFGNALVLGQNSSSYKNIRPRLHRQMDLRPGERLETDGKIMNNFVYSPFYAHERPSMRMVCRPRLTLYRDVASGYTFMPVLSASENTHAYMTALKYAIQQGGIPKECWSDNAGAADNTITNTLKWAEFKTGAGRRARDYVANGWRGMYAEFGIEPHFTTRGNPMSKNLEPAWGFTLNPFEMGNSIFTGRNINERPELWRMTNMQLVDKWGHLILSWQEYYMRLVQHIDQYNNTPRHVLERLDGAPMTPKEMYFSYDHKRPPMAELDEKLFLRWPTQATVRQGEVKVNHRYYHHNDFGVLSGKQINTWLDETNIDQLLIGTSTGQISPELAQVTQPSCYANKEKYIQALKQRRNTEKKQAKRWVDAHYEVVEELRGDNMIEMGMDALLTEQDSIAEGAKNDRQQANLLANYQPYAVAEKPEEPKEKHKEPEIITPDLAAMGLY